MTPLEKRGGNTLTAVVAAWPEVIECHAVTRVMDFLLRAAVTDFAHYSRFVFDRLLKSEGMLSIKFSFVLQEENADGGLPLDHLGTD